MTRADVYFRLGYLTGAIEEALSALEGARGVKAERARDRLTGAIESFPDLFGGPR
jgi:hypothetical protein